MRPGVAPASEAEEMEVEANGLLAGIAGVVQPSSVITASLSAPARPEHISTKATLARAKLWRELITRSAQPLPLQLPHVRIKKVQDRIERWLVYGVVLLAVFVPVFAGIDLSNFFPLDEPLTGEVDTVYNLVNETVVENAPILLAFDYDPSYMGELYLQAEVMLHHLAQRRARIMAISLTPEGAGLAQQLFDDVLGDRDDYLSGRDYVNLGYLPGEAVGIRSLEFLPRQFQGETFDGKDLKDELIFESDADFKLSKVALVVVLTGNGNNLRWWVEQTTVLEKEHEMDLPLIAGVSAAIEPLVRPYYDMASRQIDGLIVGLAGAVDYESKLNWQDGPAHIRISGQLTGQVAVLALTLIGMLVYGLRRGSQEAT
jgi:hypothetical protein